MVGTKIYIGMAEEENTVKIGFTDRTCWARCSKADYHIFAAGVFCDRTLSMAETLFMESFVRIKMAELRFWGAKQVKNDYFHFQTMPDERKWTEVFKRIFGEGISAMQDITKEKYIYGFHEGYVEPYSY